MRRVFIFLVALFFLLLGASSSVFAWDSVPSNGDFSAGLDDWSLTGSDCGHDGAMGHNALGSVFLDSSDCVLASANSFSPYSSRLYFSLFYDCWLSCGGGNRVNYSVSCANGSNIDSYVQFVDDDVWHDFEVDITGASGSCTLSFSRAGGWVHIHIDDISISNAYNGGNVTPTSAPTSAPTSTPLPTPTAGPGGGGGSNNNCPENDPCYVWIVNTPLPVSLGGTPVKIDDSTPLAIRVPTQEITPVSNSAASSQVALGAPSVYYDSNNASDGVIPINPHGSGKFSDLNQVVINKQSISFCLPAEISVAFSDIPCFSTDLMSFGALKIAGVDILPSLGVFVGALLVVFVIRQLQER